MVNKDMLLIFHCLKKGHIVMINMINIFTVLTKRESKLSYLFSFVYL